MEIHEKPSDAPTLRTVDRLAASFEKQRKKDPDKYEELETRTQELASQVDFPLEGAPSTAKVTQVLENLEAQPPNPEMDKLFNKAMAPHLKGGGGDLGGRVSDVPPAA